MSIRGRHVGLTWSGTVLFALGAWSVATYMYGLDRDTAFWAGYSGVLMFAAPLLLTWAWSKAPGWRHPQRREWVKGGLIVAGMLWVGGLLWPFM